MAAIHDLIILGAGSAGLATAFRAARHGANVALLDPASLGGTCVHRGCVPKKSLWFAAQLAQAQRLAVEFGFDSHPGSLDWGRFRNLRQQYIDGIARRYVENLQQSGVHLVRDAGRFVGPQVIELSDGRRLRAPHILIATGARPRHLPLPGFELGLVSDDMFELQQMPKRLVVVGGGYVAVEFAGVFRALGAEVDLLVRGPLLRGFDTELVQVLTQKMEGAGMRIYQHEVIRSAHRAPEGIMLVDDKTGKPKGPYNTLLWAVGREPNSQSLGLDKVGVLLDDHGHVSVDAFQNTTVAGIYAVGDVTGQKALTPVAVVAGRRLADRLYGDQPDAKLDQENIPSVLFAESPLAMVGLTEQQARERHGAAITVHRSRFTPMQWALAHRREQTLMKLVCLGHDERVVGIHLLGPGAEEMLQGFAVSIKLGLRKRDLDATLAIHPTSAEELVLMG